MVWVEGQVIRRHDWAPGLITLGLDTVAVPFVPGQFVNLALDRDGVRVKRSYSLASAAGEPSEFYLAHVPGGALTPALFDLEAGDRIWIDTRALGFFTLDHVPEARDLWLMSTGTGLGPFIAMLRSPSVWERFSRIVLVHGVRVAAHLGYRAELLRWVEQRPTQFSYVPLITREATPPGALFGRLPELVARGELEQHVALELAPESAHVLLCGNPAMIAEAQTVLGERGLHKHRPRKPGHITIESYW
jgi:ferredoxin--NADP+ reductase